MTSTGKASKENTGVPDTKGTPFPKTARLLEKKQFDPVFSRALKVSNAHFLVLVHERAQPLQDGSSRARLGLVISKKVDKRAVARNRLKRLVRESFRRQKALPPCDFVVIGRAAARQASNAEISRGLEQLWHQASLKFTQRRRKS